MAEHQQQLQHRAAGPRSTTLDLLPGVRLGPFSLGASFWRTINYLRANHDTYPSIKILWDASSSQGAPQCSGSSSFSRTGQTTGVTSSAAVAKPIVVSASDHLHLAFDARYQRLQTITLDDLPHFGDPTLKNDHEGASVQARKGKQGREAWQRPFSIVYRGRHIYSSSSTSTAASQAGTPLLTRSAIHQIFGPTYPGQERERGDGTADEAVAASSDSTNKKRGTSGGSLPRAISGHATPSKSLEQAVGTAAAGAKEFVLSYPGVAFSFPMLAASAADENGEGKLTGPNRHVAASTLYIFSGKAPHAAPVAAVADGGDEQPVALSWPMPRDDRIAATDASRARSSRGSSSFDADGGAFAYMLDEQVFVDSATVFPGEGVRLQLCAVSAAASSSNATSRPERRRGTAPSASLSPSPSGRGSDVAGRTKQDHQVVTLALGRTTVQDVLCELGSPEARCWKEDERMGIHQHQQHPVPHSSWRSTWSQRSASGGVGASGRAGGDTMLNGRAHAHGDDEDDGDGDDDDDGDDEANGLGEAQRGPQPFFFNYFSLGFDLLFEYSNRSLPVACSNRDARDGDEDGQQEGPVLSKIICHSNTPGHALFGRYQRLPWHLARPGSRMPSSHAADGGDADVDMETNAGPQPDFLRPYEALVASGALPVQPIVSAQHEHRETMLLDRSSDAVEFKELLQLDVSSSLHGHPGVVLEVSVRDGLVACITVLAVA
ncbi:hypothetical protein K437DRAFT_273319 [Tilletiaria anomala UBC 951]|uniref:Uncharacterized protein n=1 Tax=Tilletiaria anomala (strain ATCC 24038 / CBS 436.72 / UBC 951) TaxID=1037660 RepID=A0A066WDS4_TILAU|nr:uncharacterized protein K437DRAFT_273319 [Tilletiaria anomala UBC 951]KDN49249.1 hypothetical protein K437DRAFT_273319 [Tilletiaria anomala UBC 951]